MAGGDPRPRIGFGALEPRLSARIQPRIPRTGKQLILGDKLVTRLRVEMSGSVGRFSGFRSPSLDKPSLKAAVENGDVARAEVAEHEPAARRRSQR